MAAYVTRGMREKMASDAAHDRAARAVKVKRPMTPVPFEWHTAQTKDAVKFPSYGWVPVDAIRWQKADGTVVGWPAGRQGDQLLIASEFVARKA